MITKFKRLGLCLTIIALVSTSFAAHPSTTQAASSEEYTWNNVVTGGGGGFIPGIIFNTKEKDLIYARTDIGGAYRWNKTNSSWTPLTDSVGWTDWNKNGVDALATDPVDPNRVYMATGTYTNDWDPNNGQIMRSTDRGDTWQVTKLPFKVGGNMPGRSMGERLVIDPNKNNILYFGARSGNGLWKSTDYGVTWNKVTSFTNTGTYIEDPSNSYQGDIVGLAWITFDPKSGSAGNASQKIYVGVADKANSVYRSTDGGATWSAVAGQPKGYIPHHGVLASDGNLYIPYSNGAGPYDGTKGEVWKLNTTTGVWTNISPVPSSSEDNFFGYGGLAVDAQNPQTIVVATLNSWWPDANLYRSTNGGATWSAIWDWDGYPNRNLKYTQDISAAPWLDFGANPSPPEPAKKLGWMIGDLEIDPFNSNRMMYGTGATIYGTNNLTGWDTGTKVNISVMAKGVEETAVADLISPPSGAPLISGVYDVSGFRHDDLTKAPAKMLVNPNSTTSLDFAESNPNFIVHVGKGGDNSSIGLSSDGGSNWYSASSQPSGTKGEGTVAVSPNSTNIVWSTSDIGVYTSKSGGSSWTASKGIPANAKVRSDRVNSNKFYGYANGKFYVSTDGGSNFTATAATGLPTEGAANFKTVPGKEGHIWFAGGNSTSGPYGLWRSTDSGATFTKISAVQEADVVGLGKAAPNKSYMAIYVSAKIDNVRGVFRSDDEGATWVRINDDKHQYASINMAITGDPRVYGRVYLGTNGRGILYADRVGGGTTNPNPDPDPVKSSVITPTSSSFDKKTANQANLPITLTLNGNTFQSIKNGTATLVSGTDYTVSGNTVTILKSYLSKQVVGNTTLTFNFSAGNSATLTINVIDSTNAASGNIKVQMFNGTTTASTNTINPKFNLVNTGTTAINLSDVKLRYYYTINGVKEQNFFCDWSQIGSDNVTGSFVALPTSKSTADYYLEIGFKSGAGSLAPGKNIEIQTRISKSDWTNYTQSDDYSFSSTNNAYADWSKVTGYISGSLQWGIEP